MQIVTIEDQIFPQVFSALQESHTVGKCHKKGQVQIVRANNRFMLVTREDDPERIAIKPVTSIAEAEMLANRYLDREEERGFSVERQ